MKRNWMKASFAALLLAITAAACESIAESELTGPSRDPNADVITYLVNGVRVVQETDPAVGTVTGKFGVEGGILMLGNHKLIIPAGAVTRDVYFKMVKSGSALKFDLTATSPNSLFQNNVGSAGFEVPVKLSISYAGTSAGDPSAFQVAWLRLLGNQVQPSTLDAANQSVVGELRHFSDYALIFP